MKQAGAELCPVDVKLGLFELQIDSDKQGSRFFLSYTTVSEPLICPTKHVYYIVETAKKGQHFQFKKHKAALF